MLGARASAGAAQTGMKMSNASQDIPIIDIGSLWASPGLSDVAALARQVDAACRSIGFFYVVNHAVPPAIVTETFAANLWFHAKPFEEKMLLKLNKWHRGYQAIGGSTLVSSQRFAAARHANQLESFFMRHEVDPDDPAYMSEPLQGPNQWPGDPWFRRVVEAYDHALKDLGMKLLQVFSTAVGEQPGYFDRRFAPPSTALRLIHYPPAPQRRPEDLYGIHPHTDYGFLTILAQDDVGGLEIQRRDGQWVAVPAIPGTFIINIGDALARWTNDQFNSTPHRVINPSTERPRYSIGYFFDPSLGTEVRCLPSFVGGSAPARYDAIRYGDYFSMRLDANYADRIGV
ncbi:MAG: isopenicillin N synthase family oxygenase [Alphaproteobacteria bacterium]|nr:isopenicillin N synthase family oxygenase [Alphaproteobacteria bacterium]